MGSDEDLLRWRLSDERHDRELWEFEYRVNPYLKNISDAKLDRRLRDLRRNLAYLICPLRDDVPQTAHFLSTWWWLRKRVHTLAEFARRGREAPESAEPIAFASASAPLPCVPRHPNACDFATKYGEARWLVPMVERGIIRVAPASSYSGEQVDGARYDDELSKHRYQLGDSVRITTRDGRSMPIIGDLRRTASFPNYYVLCASNEFDYRLPACFPNAQGEPADTAIVIWDLDEFARRLDTAARAQLAGWYFHHNPVSYFDPYDIGRREHVDAGMSKDYLYAYQREYRFLWLPLRGGVTGDALFLAMGPLEDIAGVFRADGSFIAGRRSA